MISNFLDVVHLPAAASFYSSILQPLNLHNLSTDKDPKDPSTSSVTYGGPREPSAFFQLKKTSQPKRSQFTLSAPSAEAVSRVHQLALSAYPNLAKAPSSIQFLHLGKTPNAETRTRITDTDGNIMEVVYMPPSNYPPGYSGSTVRKTECTTDEVSRILNWNYDVAASASDARTVVSRAPPSTVGGRTAVMRRGPTAGSTFTPGPTATATRPAQGSGISSATVISAVVAGAAGIAAGAAITYGVMKSWESNPAQQEPQPGVLRRATMPETGHVTGEVESTYTPPKRAIEAAPRSTVSRTVDDMGYDIDDRMSGITITDRKYPPSTAGTRVSTRSRARSTSETGGQRRPLLLAGSEYPRTAYAPSGVGSAAPSRYTKRAPTEYQDERPLMANIPLDPSIYPAGKAPSTFSKAPSKAPSMYSKAPTEYQDERPLMANIPLDPNMYPASTFERAPSVYSKAPSKAPTKAPSMYNKAPTEYQDERPLMANIPLDPNMYPAEKAPSAFSKAPPKAPTKAPSVYSKAPTEYQDERPLMANIPLDPNMYPAEKAPSVFSRAAPSAYQDERPLMANIPLDNTADYTSTSRRGSGDEPTYVLDANRRTTRPPVVGGGGASVAGTRYEASAPRWDSPSVYDAGKGSKYVTRSKAGSRVGTTEDRIPHNSGRSVVVNNERKSRSRSRGRSQAGTYVGARNVGMPKSTTGWDDDDLDSVAPGDSISCVGR